MFLLELLDKIGHCYYCPYTSKLNYTIQTPARYEAKHDAKSLISVLIAHFGSVQWTTSSCPTTPPGTKFWHRLAEGVGQLSNIS